MPVDLACTRSGTGSPLAILHGLFGAGTNWRSVARRLAPAHTCVVADLRNHGASPHAPGMDYRTLAADVETLLAREQLTHTGLIGHSMGGKTAMQLALDTPERVAWLVVVDIAPLPSDHDHLPVIEAMRRVRLDGVERRADIDAQLQAAIPEAGLRQFLLQNLIGAQRGFRWRINLDAIEAGMPALLDFPEQAPGACYPGPALFIRGERSDYVGDAALEAIERLFPAARVHTIEDAGHWVHAEQPGAFLECLAAFLRDVAT